MESDFNYNIALKESQVEQLDELNSKLNLSIMEGKNKLEHSNVLNIQLTEKLQQEKAKLDKEVSKFKNSINLTEDCFKKIKEMVVFTTYVIQINDCF